MADGETTRPVQSGKTPEVEELDGFKFGSFEQGEQVNSFVTSQRKRVPKRSYASFGLTTLSLTNDTATRLKKRSRKDDKRVVVDRVDGFTFISAFNLNDFDEYEKNPVKQPLAPTKRKASTKNQSATSSKKVKKSECSTPELLGTGVNVVEEGQSNLTPKKSPVVEEASPSKKTVSPLTKSALVRLKKISVSSLNKNSPVNKQMKDVQDSSKDPNKSNSSCSKSKKSINLKVPLMNMGKHNSPKKSNNSKIPHMQIDKPTLDGETTRVLLSDEEDNLELDVCGVDENSSSQFILSNMNQPESGSAEPKNEETSKQKRKPCRVCCAYPCRIVGARRMKSSGNQFPSFDVSYTSRCQVHTPGEIELNEPSQGKANICIQTTFTDIRMHLDFARRFPYRTISVVSCQPSLYDDDLKLPDNLATGTNQRCSENHRILEQKRREELHGLYCKLADTLSISKNRASKQWILENALKEVKSLEAKDILLTADLNSEKSENDKKRKRWEALAGKPYVAPAESAAKVASKSKLMELYKQYRQERDNCPTKKDEENSKVKDLEIKNVVKQEEVKLQGRENVKKELQKKIKKSQSRKLCNDSKKQKQNNNPAGMLRPVPTPKFNNSAVCESQSVTLETKDTVNSNNSISKPSLAAQNPASKHFSLGSVNSTPMTAIHGGPETKHIQPISIGTVITTVKQAPLGPSQIVRPFQHTPISSRSPSIPVIPKIDLTTESSPNQPDGLIHKSNPLSELSHLLATNPNLATTASTMTTQTITTLLKSPPPNQSSALPQTATPSFPTSIAHKPNLSPPSVDSNMECVVVTMVVKGKKIVFKIPKTAEGLTLLSRLSSLKMLSPDSLSKIAAQFPANQSGQSASATTGLGTSLVTPTQWSAVASSPSMSITVIPQPAQESIAAAAFKTNNSSIASTTRPINQSTTTQSLEPNSGSFATISRPIKEPIATTVKTSSGNVGTTSQAKQSIHLNAMKVENSSDVSVSEKVKPFNAVKPSRIVNIGQTCTKSSDVSQQQRKVIFFDLTRNNKAEAKPFSVIPAPSSINVTLNKLGSITANKVYNKRAATVQSQDVPPNACFTTGLAPSASQTNPRNTNFTNTSAPSTSQTNQPKLRYEYQLHQTIPVQILPKCLPDTNVLPTIQDVPMSTTSIHIHPAPPPRIPSDELPEELPEIPPDIPNDLTRASSSPLQTIPEISDSLLDDTCKKDVDNVDEPGFCVISNVFSLTETTNAATPNELEKITDAAVVTVDSSMTATTDGDIVN